MAVILKLEQGADTLDINTGRYCVDDVSFSPPTAARSVTFGQASVGSDTQSKRRENRGWNFRVTIKGSSPQEAERGLRELQSFLNGAGRANPLYVAYRSWNDYTYEPFFGLHGAFMRYEVVHAAVEAGRNYNTPLASSSAIVNADISLVIKPQAVGLQMQSGKATGGIFEDFIGKANGASRGTVIAEATTNKFTNPAFMNATYDTGWTSTNVLDTGNKGRRFVLFGDTSARIVQTAANGEFTQSLNVGNTNAHALSFYAKREDGGAVDASVLRAFYGSAQTTTFVSVGDGWYWCWAAVTGVASATDTGVVFAATLANNSTAVYVDGFQVEEKAYPTPFCYGDMLGCTWASTKNASTSTRAAAVLKYNYDEVLDKLIGWTIRIAWVPRITDLSTDTYLLADADRDLRLWLDSSQRYNAGTITASTTQSSAVTLTAGTPEVIHMSFDGSSLVVYRNGASLDSGSLTPNTTLPATLFVGASDSPANQLNASIMDLATFSRVMSAADVLADYNAMTQQATDGDRIGPLPWFWTDGGDNVLDNDNDGTEANYAVVGGLMGDDVDTAFKLNSDSTFDLRQGVSWGSLAVDQRDFDKDILTDGGTNSLLFEDGTGTANTSANNDVVLRISSLSTVATAGPQTPITEVNANVLRNASSVVGYFVAVDTADVETVQVRLEVLFSADINDAWFSPWRTLDTDTTLRPYITHELPLDFDSDILDGRRQVGLGLRFKRTSGSANFDISHTIFFVNYSAVYTGDIGATGTADRMYGSGRLAYVGLDASPNALKSRRTFNRPLIITPEKLNALMFQQNYRHNGATSGTWASSADTTNSATVEQFALTPRFDIF